MDKDTKELLDSLSKNVGRLADGGAVKTAATVTPRTETEGGDPAPTRADEIASKGLSSKTMDEDYRHPLTHSFERLAKAAPAHFSHLGTRKALDDPFTILRAKNADGSYVLKNSDLDLIIKGMLAINGSGKDAVGNGATHIEEWIAKSGNPAGTVEGAFEQAIAAKGFGEASSIVRKAVDTSVGGALIRTDIEPILREAFNRVFPAFDYFRKIPANGLKHTWNQITSPGAATLLSELGDFSTTASNQTYSQVQSTNIAVAASQREIGLKAMWASQQSGMSFNLGGNNNTEVMGAITAIANVIQAQIFQGNADTAAKTKDDEEGAYNTLGFTGFRQQLMSGSYSITKSGTYLAVLRQAVGQLVDAGASLDEIVMFLSIGAQNDIDSELETFYQFVKTEAGAPQPVNYGAAGLTMLNGILARMKPVPAAATQTNGVGYYTFSAATTEDIYVLDPNGTALPYIGSPGPTILELPTGWGNHLSNTYVPFIMIGLAIYVKLFNRKIRITKTTL